MVQLARIRVEGVVHPSWLAIVAVLALNIRGGVCIIPDRVARIARGGVLIIVDGLSEHARRAVICQQAAESIE